MTSVSQRKMPVGVGSGNGDTSSLHSLSISPSAHRPSTPPASSAMFLTRSPTTSPPTSSNNLSLTAAIAEKKRQLSGFGARLMKGSEGFREIFKPLQKRNRDGSSYSASPCSEEKLNFVTMAVSKILDDAIRGCRHDAVRERERGLPASVLFCFYRAL